MDGEVFISRAEHETFAELMKAENSRIHDENKRQNKRLDTIEETLKENTDLIVSIKELVVETKHMREDLNETIQRLDKLESKNGEKWDKFKWLIVAGLVTLILGYIAVTIGIK